MDNTLKYFIISTLRRASYRWPARTEAANKARIRRGVYTCAHCKKETPNKEKRIDHIDPVVDPKTGFTGWDTYITRMFPGSDKFQILCLECHDIKTASERNIRKNFKA